MKRLTLFVVLAVSTILTACSSGGGTGLGDMELHAVTPSRISIAGGKITLSGDNFIQLSSGSGLSVTACGVRLTDLEVSGELREVVVPPAGSLIVRTGAEISGTLPPAQVNASSDVVVTGPDGQVVTLESALECYDSTPTVTAFSKALVEDTILSFATTDFTSNYSDFEEGAITGVKIVALPDHGTLKLLGAAVAIGQAIAVDDLTGLTYTPSTNYNGSDSFSWTATDGSAYSATSAGVSIIVSAVNDAPVATVVGNQLVYRQTAYDYYARSVFSDPEGDPFTLTVSGQPASMSLAGGHLIGTPSAGELGEYVVTLAAEDVAGATASMSFSLEVTEACLDSDLVVYVPDGNLRRAINDELGRASGAVLTCGNIQGLVDLWASNYGIASLEGLQHASNLEDVALMSNGLTNVDQLSTLTSLAELYLEGNRISDLSVLENLQGLQELDLSDNLVTDLTPLQDLTALTDLALSDNPSNDITPLQRLTGLGQLDIDSTSVSDLSALQGLTSLYYLTACAIPATDIQPLLDNAGIGMGDMVVLPKGVPVAQWTVLEARNVYVIVCAS